MLYFPRQTLAICSIAFSVVATSASADTTGSSENYLPAFTSGVSRQAKATVKSNRKARTVTTQVKAAGVSRHATVTVQSKRKTRRVTTQQAAAYAATSASYSPVVAEARRYLGTNPTKRRSLWCGAFMNLVLERTGHKRGPSDLAKSFASYGQRIPGPQVGALAVMSRGRRGGHVGVVSGIDPSGNVIVVSGNHNNTVAESVYPRRRILAYVMPRV
jgi:uncharacterized protein (TIGR02594 family)